MIGRAYLWDDSDPVPLLSRIGYRLSADIGVLTYGFQDLH